MHKLDFDSRSNRIYIINNYLVCHPTQIVRISCVELRYSFGPVPNRENKEDKGKNCAQKNEEPVVNGESSDYSSNNEYNKVDNDVETRDFTGAGADLVVGQCRGLVNVVEGGHLSFKYKNVRSKKHN